MKSNVMGIGGELCNFAALVDFTLHFTLRYGNCCRKLCFEALIEEGDRDQDWRLNEAEFATLLDPDYEPSRKCKLRRAQISINLMAVRSTPS